MNTATITENMRNEMGKLHKAAVEGRWTKETWWPAAMDILGDMRGEILAAAKTGLDHLLNNEAVEALAVSSNPWMTNQMEFTYMYGPQKGTKGVSPSWLEKIKEEKSPRRPNDLLHLARICYIAENLEAYDDMF